MNGKWRAEERESHGKSLAGWWLTDGTESFYMASQFIAKMLANYLNAKPS